MTCFNYDIACLVSDTICVCSEGEAGNPLVAGFQDELDSEDEALAKNQNVVSAVPSDSDISSEEEEKEQTTQSVILKDADLAEDEVLSLQALKPVTLSALAARTSQKKSPTHVVKLTDESGVQAEPPSVQKPDLSLKEFLEDTSAADLHNSNVLPSVEVSVDEDEENGNSVAILADEDLSDVEETSAASSRPVDSGLATDTTQVRPYL